MDPAVPDDPARDHRRDPRLPRGRREPRRSARRRPLHLDRRAAGDDHGRDPGDAVGDRGYRERGVLRRLRTTPVHPGALLFAQAGLHAAAVLVSVALALGVARLVYGVPLSRAVAWYAVCAVLATAATSSIGAVVTAAARTTRVVQTVGTIVLFPCGWGSRPPPAP
ncbi:ABC transporter permease [Geodermatophilus sp. SYSU D00758]